MVKFKLQAVAGIWGLWLNSVQFSKPLRSAQHGQQSVASVGLEWWSAPKVLGESLSMPETGSFLPRAPFWAWGSAGVQTDRCGKTRCVLSFM